jgi:hypothetical protein
MGWVREDVTGEDLGVFVFLEFKFILYVELLLIRLIRGFV